LFKVSRRGFAAAAAAKPAYKDTFYAKDMQTSEV